MNRSDHPTTPSPSASAQESQERAGEAAAPPDARGECFTATHEALYSEAGTTCDGCGASLESPRRATGPALLWVRGDARELEQRMLCDLCAATVGISWMRAAAESEGEDG